jgi:serine kinase of HPr protein (carbohydrate metabolism regulator)
LKLREIIKELNLEIAAGENIVDTVDVDNAYVGDLMGDVLDNAQPGSLWVTVHIHSNVAVISREMDFPAVIITNGNEPRENTAKLARQFGIVLLVSKENSFEVASSLQEIGFGKEMLNR